MVAPFIADFWLIVILIISLVSSCIGCCVRMARNRQLQQYQAIRNQQAPGYGTVVVASAAVPSYPGPATGPQAPPYSAAGAVSKPPTYNYDQPPKYPVY